MAELPKTGMPLNQFGPGEIKAKGSGRWVYVGFNDEFTWRMGYCRDLQCEGHASKEGAIEHFKEWLIDEQTSYDGQSPSLGSCMVCAESTNMYATVRWLGWEFKLCKEHLNREEVHHLIGNLDPLYR